jgi:hypothetical protein
VALIEEKEETTREIYYGGGTKFTVPRLRPLVLSCKGRLRSKGELWKVMKIRWPKTGVVVGNFLRVSKAFQNLIRLLCMGISSAVHEFS